MDSLAIITSYFKYKEVRSLFDALRCIPYAHIKGEVLSVQAYGSTGNRKFSDIDLLILRKDFEMIKKILCEEGFKQPYLSRKDKITILSSSHQTLPWYKNSDSLGYVHVDLNFDVFWGEYEGKRIDIEEFITDTTEYDNYGLKTKALSPMKSLLQLSLHHYKDMNSIFLLATRNSITYDMFKDVYYLLKNNMDTITLDQLYSMSVKYEIVPYVFYVLYYTGQVFEDETLKQYIEAFRTPEGERIINCYGLCEKEQKEWKCDFQTRLKSENLYDLIKDDLTERDKEKIAINRRVFLGGAE